MNKSRTMLALGFVMAAMVTAPIGASAQVDPSNQLVPSLVLNQADVRDALKILFKNVDMSYTVATDVQGTVTATLKNVPFETALQSLLKQVDATYRVEDHIYAIVKKPPTGDFPVKPGDNIAPAAAHKSIIRIRIQHGDPLYIYELLLGHGTFGMPPEISSLLGSGGGFGNGGFGSGNNGPSNGGSGFGSGGPGVGFGNGSGNSGGGNAG